MPGDPRLLLTILAVIACAAPSAAQTTRSLFAAPDYGWDDSFHLPFPGIKTMTLHDGQLYVGGDFVWAGDSVAANHVARWDGTRWSALGAGVDGPVMALAFDAAGNLIVGGSFTSAGGTAASNIARWNGSSWSGLGGGINGPVLSLAVDGNDHVFAGGQFNKAEGVFSRGVARWDGAHWFTLATNFNDSRYDDAVYFDVGVDVLVLDGLGRLYAGGRFTWEGIDNVMAWEGGSWLPLGSGLNRRVRSLAVGPNGVVYAGGDFLFAGRDTATHTAVWNGTKWSGVGSGTNGIVHAVAVDARGTAYAAGDFTRAGKSEAANIARWRDSNWEALGSGIRNAGSTGARVTTMAMDYDGNVYVGGDFSLAGDKESLNLGLWHTDMPPVTLAERLRVKLEAVARSDGNQLRWRVEPAGVVSTVILESARRLDASWVANPAERSQEGAVTVALDRAAPVGHERFYRLRIIATDGSERLTGPVSATRPPPPVPQASLSARAVATGIELRWSFVDPSNVKDVRVVRSFWPDGQRYPVEVEVHDEAGVSVAIDTDVLPNTRYYYRIIANVADLYTQTYGPVDATLVIIQSEGFSIPRTALSVVAPNPSSDRIQIHFEVSRSAPIYIDVVDLTGRVAAVLLDETREPGFHHVDWDGRSLRPGLYFVRLKGPDGQSVKRLSRVP